MGLIEPNEHKEEAIMYWKDLEDQLLKHKKEKEEQALEATKAQEEQNKFNSEVEEVKTGLNIANANKENIIMAPLKPLLYPIQLLLGKVVYTLRFTSSVFLWQSSYVSFWVTFTSLVLFLVFLIIPWAFIITWVMRILVWTLLGPWMKLVDWYYYKPLEQLSESDQAIQKEQTRKMRQEAYDKVLENYKVAEEDAVKLRAMKMRMFGDYVVSVPHFHLPMLADNPLPESSAKYYDESSMQKGLKPIHICGQHLVGTMIPIPADEALIIAAKEEEEKKKKSSGSFAASISNCFATLAEYPKNMCSRSSDKSDLTVPLQSPSEKEQVTSYGGVDLESGSVV